MRVSDLELKVSNDGATSQGQLTAEEYNTLLGAVQGHDKRLPDLCGDIYYDPSSMILYGFASTEDKQAWLDSGDQSLVKMQTRYIFAGKQNQLKITTAQPTTLWFTTTAQKAEITVGFSSRQKDITATEWEDIPNDVVTFSVLVDKGNSSVWETIVDSKQVSSGETLTVDVRKYIDLGANKVQFVGVSQTTEETARLIFAANVTAMFLAPANFDWATPFVEGNNYVLGSLNLGGNLEKVLHVLVTGDGYSKQYDVARPAQSEPTYYFEGLEFPTAGTGVYNVELWLTAAGVESEHLTYDIMCIAAADVATAQLVVMNETPAEVENYSEADIFKYACYNAGASTAAPAVRVEVGSIVIADEQLSDVPTQTAHTFSAPIEIETEATNLAVAAEINFGNTAQRNIPLNNAASFPATPDATFYLQPSARSNSQPNREQVVNAVTGEAVETTAECIAWVDGIDGWTTDEEGRRCLRIPAGSRLTVARQLLASISSAGKSIEFVYRVRTATEDDPVITICDDPTSASFRGLKILPEQIILHSRDLNVSDLSQSYFVETEALLDVVVSIIQQFRNDKNLHVAIIFVNGVKACEFSYSATDSFATAADLIMGSLTSDIDIYAVREYNRAFTSEAALRNQEASLRTREEKAQAKAENTADLDAYGNMSYKAVKGRVNTFTVKMRDGASLPSYGKDKEYFAYCDLTIDIVQKAWKVVLQWLRIEGQGTTSMHYWLWNLRYRIDKSGNVIIIYPDGTEATIGNVWFDGVGVHPAVERLTFKKNYASSMQSHKMGSCRMFNEVIFYLAEKHPDWELLNEAGALMAVYQYPAHGYELTEVENSDELADRWMGLFTIGPDKNDPATFGYDKYKDTLLRFEGLDHNYKAVGFDYPYHRLKYVAENESVCYKKSDAWQKAWEVGAAGTAKNEDEVQAYLDEEYAPMYKLVYDCSTMLLGATATLDEMNANVEAWNKQTDSEGHAYARYEFWRDGEYDVLYLDEEVQQFRANGTNLLTQLGITAEELEGLTIDEKNERFKEARRAIFRAQAANYINVRQNIITMQHGLIIAATDNLKKNTYFDKFTDTADGGRYRQKRDDDDSIFRTDNQGYPSKKYSVEQYDWTDATKTAYVFKGEDSRFFRLLTECFPDECQECGREILAAMAANAVGNDSMSRLIAYIDQTFFAPAQKYFSRAAYNADTELAYEQAFPHYVNGDYEVDVNPLAQAHGSSLESERAWAVKRMIYMASKFRFGAFAEYTNASLGRITFRTQQTISLTLTPAMDLYPCVLSGQGGGVYAPRTFKGESVTLAGVGGTNTNVYIMAADYLEDIGDLCQLPVDASTNATLGISSKRLKRLKIGDEVAENVTSNVQTLDITNAPALLSLDARNLASLTDNIDLTSCTRIEEALLGGTNVRSVTLLRGSKIERLQLSDSMTSLSLLSVAYLTPDTLEYNTLANIEYLRLENNAQLNGFALLKEAFNTEGSQLKNIRVVGFDYEGDATDLDMLATLANGSYTGIDADGRETTGLPVIESTLRIDSPVYEDSLTIVKATYPALNIIAEGGYYIRFEDDEVQRVLLANGVGDGVGITTEQAEAVTTIGTWFEGNTAIEHFDEFDKFTRVTSLINSAFRGDINLRSITLNSSITSIGISAFNNCSALEVEINLPYLTSLGLAAFYSAGIKSFKADALESIYGDDSSNSTFSYCKNLTTVDLPSIKSVGNFGFHGCTSLRSVNIETVESLGISAFKGCTSLGGNMYLPNLVGALPLGAFLGTAITSFIAPKLTDINGDNETNSAFTDCNELQEVILDSIQTIGRRVFQNRTSLRSIKIDTVEEIGANAFYNCTSLEIEELNLPNLKTLGSNAFYGVSFKKISNLGSITTLNTGIGDASVLEEIVLPDTITSIPANCFKNYSALKSIKMDGVTTMYGDCFINTTNLQEFVAPNLETVNGSQHLRASGITKFIAPKLQNANEWICTYTPNIRLVLLRDITTIASRSFSNNSTYEAFVCLNPTPPTLAWNAFQSTNIESGTGSIYVPDGTTTDADGNTITIVEAYKAATNWSTYAARIFPISQLQTDNPELYAEIEEYL